MASREEDFRVPLSFFYASSERTGMLACSFGERRDNGRCRAPAETVQLGTERSETLAKRVSSHLHRQQALLMHREMPGMRRSCRTKGEKQYE